MGTSALAFGLGGLVVCVVAKLGETEVLTDGCPVVQAAMANKATTAAAASL